MTNKRTEEEKIVQAGIVVTLGGEEFKIAPLVIKYSGEWRKKALPIISHLLKYSQLATDNKTDEKELEQAFTDLFTTRTDEMLDSFFEYARELDREKIEEIATDGDIILAFMEVFNAFVAPLSSAGTKRMKPRQSGKSLSSS